MFDIIEICCSNYNETRVSNGFNTIIGVTTVNKNELISSISNSTGLTKTDSAKALDAFLDSVTLSLKKGDDVRLVGFGTFSVAKRSATTGRNPRTGAAIKIPARKQAKFKAGKALQDSVN